MAQRLEKHQKLIKCSWENYNMAYFRDTSTTWY